ncbi:sensor histidine kinase [Dyadobacter subterraneus]|uniref:Histidine kinase n=1 Tax=Dyadobacter subterraneus TaxID=2773304 RepID=A0ABR9WDS5_9BACT|nr:histidine kinase [Dyadobacter subterraneus]MBE9463634.1 histidine kinase [Dyadobacter subterraneus]
MINKIEKARYFSDKVDFFIYLGLLLWIAIIETLNTAGSWQTYVSCAGSLLISQGPVLFFTWKEQDWKTTFTKEKYRTYQIAYFGIYLPLLALGSSLMLDGKTQIWEVVLLGTVCTLFLKMILLANNYYVRRISAANWVRRLSLEKAILISITFIAVMLSAMAVSSLDNPLYDTEKQLLIGFEFNLAKVLTNFLTFLSYSGQLLIMYLCGYFFFLINSRILVAKILKEKGVLFYILSSLALIGIFYPAMGQLLSILPFSKRLGGMFSQNPFVWENAFGAIIILLISLPVLLAAQWSRQNTLIVSLEKEKAEAELDLLKQQLNPHFFFNTLNNLYALSLQKSEETPEVILQLSDLMRYVIYKAKDPYVKIEEEIQYLKDYLQLQSIRLSEKFDLKLDIDIKNANFLIAPLVLVVFIENAIKHGIEAADANAFLEVVIKSEGQKLYFICENSFEPEPENNAGIGLNNLQKRLELLYPGKYLLKIKKENTIFRVELELENYEYALPDR